MRRPAASPANPTHRGEVTVLTTQHSEEEEQAALVETPEASDPAATQAPASDGEEPAAGEAEAKPAE